MMAAQNVLFLRSRGGGNLRFLHSLVQSGSLQSHTFSSVTADHECPAVDRPVTNSLRAEVVSISRGDQAFLIAGRQSHTLSFIVKNVHENICAGLIRTCKNKILSLHYSLLPSFGGTIGMQSLSNALTYGCKIVGATAHHVTEELDSGPPIAQVALGSADCQINENLTDLMFRAGCIALYTALFIVNDTSLALAPVKAIQVKEAIFLVSPSCELPCALASEGSVLGGS